MNKEPKYRFLAFKMEKAINRYYKNVTIPNLKPTGRVFHTIFFVMKSLTKEAKAVSTPPWGVWTEKTHFLTSYLIPDSYDAKTLKKANPQYVLLPSYKIIRQNVRGGLFFSGSCTIRIKYP